MVDYTRVKGTCQRCDFVFMLAELRKEWTNLKVCNKCFDPRPAENRPPNVRPEGVPVPGASPETTPTFRAPGDKGNAGDLP